MSYTRIREPVKLDFLQNITNMKLTNMKITNMKITYMNITDIDISKKPDLTGSLIMSYTRIREPVKSGFLQNITYMNITSIRPNTIE